LHMMTKRGLYTKLVAEMGWIYEYSPKGNRIGKKQITGHESIVEEDDVPSWGSFRDYWRKNHPELIVGASIKDICNDCYVFATNTGIVFIGKRKGQEEKRKRMAQFCSKTMRAWMMKLKT
jgi:hypothetical protein